MTLEQKAREAIEQAYVNAEKYYNRKFMRPTISFSRRMTRTAGKAMYKYTLNRRSIKEGEIRLSTVLLEMNTAAFLKDTPSHEVAHLVAVELYGERGHGHGPEWQDAMTAVGNYEGGRCHSFETPKRKKFRYKCKTTGTFMDLGPIQHKRCQEKGMSYQNRKKGASVSAEDYIEPVLV